MMSVRKAVTCSAPVNIAVIKYWGKRDEELILPINSSLSVALDQNEFKATTTIALSRTFPQDRIWLNGREELADSPRLKRCLEEVRRLALEQHPHSDQYEGHVHICSVNNFPTAAGLASSAAGYACLVYALSKLYDISGDISSIARQGSGSACRSVFGGFVKWERGEQEDGRDSVAVQVAPATHWSELEILILVVSAERKMVSSTAGMQASVRTSQLLKHRAEVIVPQRIKEMEKAILGRDFQVFGKLTMQDSNQLHATCLDTFPPIHYLSATSHKVIQLATKYNELHSQIKVAYTFDAGPNAVLFVLSRDVPDVLDFICHCFPPGPDMDRHHYIRGISAGRHPQLADTSMAAQLQFTPMPGALQYILHTKVGEGPQMLSDNDACLLNADGLPELS